MRLMKNACQMGAGKRAEWQKQIHKKETSCHDGGGRWGRKEKSSIKYAIDPA